MVITYCVNQPKPIIKNHHVVQLRKWHKEEKKGANSIYTFSSLTTHEINIKSTFFGVSIKDVIKIINIKIKIRDKWRYREIIIHL